jgi:hypothetical protein
MAKLMNVHVEWSTVYRESGERMTDSVGFTLSRGCIHRHFRGSMTQGTVVQRDVPICDVVAILRRVRAERVQGRGVASVVCDWDDGAVRTEQTAYRAGRHGNRHDRPEVEPIVHQSTAVNMIVDYLLTGDEGAIMALADYLGDKFPRSLGGPVGAADEDDRRAREEARCEREDEIAAARYWEDRG